MPLARQSAAPIQVAGAGALTSRCPSFSWMVLPNSKLLGGGAFVLLKEAQFRNARCNSISSWQVFRPMSAGKTELFLKSLISPTLAHSVELPLRQRRENPPLVAQESERRL